MRKILIAAVALVLVSCVHEFPNESTPAPLELEFSFDFSMEMPEMTDFKSEPADHLHDLRYQVRAYRILNNGTYAEQPMASFSFIKDEVDEIEHVERVTLPEGRYRLLAWIDYINHGTNADLYYNTTDFSQIRVNGDWQGSVNDKDVFMGECEIDLTRYGSEVPPVKAVFELSRPVAKFEIITTDLEKFKTKMLEAMLKNQDSKTGQTKAEVELSDYYVVLTYTGYVPNMFDLTDDTVRDASAEYSFRSELSEISSAEALLGFDYIMIKPEGSAVGVDLSFYEKKNDKKIATTGNIEVPLKRGYVTRIKGEYLTKTSDGGIGIDPGFDGDHNIKLD